MDQSIVQNLFLVLAAALIGGVGARLLKLPTLFGYILAGVFFSGFLTTRATNFESIASLGIILLLFSVGIEISLSKLSRVGGIAIVGAICQIVLVMMISFLLLSLLGYKSEIALVLSAGFSLSSTALVVKILQDRGEINSIHGEIMIGWLLVQDLAVIPMVILLSALSTSGIVLASLQAMGGTIVLISAVVFLGRIAVPFIFHRVTILNSRELLILTAISLALGTAALTSLFGVSAALGAFLAGVVISETQEKHAIFSETRPLRDIFVILFFVSLGFLVTPLVVISNFWLIIALSIFVLVTKIIVIFVIMIFLGYRGKTAIATCLGLAQIGEFSFVLWVMARDLNIITAEITSIGVAVTLITFLATPFLFKSIIVVWRKTKLLGQYWPFLSRFFFLGYKKNHDIELGYRNHIIICGFGRVGKWIGKALEREKIPFVVIDYNQIVVRELSKMDIPVIYGDPAETEVLERAGVRLAKTVVITIPDRTTQEEIISYVQTVNREAKIICRVHLEEDLERINQLKIEKVIQPEFETAIAVIRNIFFRMGKSKEEIAGKIKSIRIAHTVRK